MGITKYLMSAFLFSRLTKKTPLGVKITNVKVKPVMEASFLNDQKLQRLGTTNTEYYK